MIYRLAVLLALAVLAGCSQPSATPSGSAPATPTATPSVTPPPTTPDSPDRLRDEDKATLIRLLGPDLTLDCPLTGTNGVQCGKVYAAGVKSIDAALAAMKSMPKTKPYQQMTSAAGLYKKSYSTLVRLGCFKRTAPDAFDACESISRLASYSYLNLTTPLVL
jgi:hypothetical protein